MCNFEPIKAEKIEAHRCNYSISLRLAPFAGILFHVKKRKSPVRRKKEEKAEEIEPAKDTTSEKKTAKRKKKKTK